MRLHVIVTGAGWADDLTAYAAGLSWEHGPSGPRALTLPVPLTLRRAARLYDAQGVPPRVTVRRGPRTLWAGRVDRAALAIGRDGTSITLRAVGYAAALRDIRHTALWSSTRVSDWAIARPEQGGIIANTTPDRFEIDTNNRLYITAKRDELFGSTANPLGSTAVGALYLLRPSQSSRSIVAASFDWTVAGAGWTADLITLNDDLTFGGVIPWSQTGTGSSTVTATFAGAGGLAFRFYLTGANARIAGETGDVYARLTNLRVQTTTAATVTAGAVAQALLSEITTVNGSELSDSVALIEDPGFDLTDLVYEDSYALPILQALAAKGDGAGTVFETGVDAQRRLFFRPRGDAGRQWFVNLSDLRLERPRDSVENRVYARYQDASNRVRRTDATTNAASVSRYGLTRDGVVDDETTNGTQAIAIRDTYAADVSDPQPAARFGVARIQRAGGAVVAGDEVLPGDTVTVLGLPGRLTGLDRVRSFRVGESGYDADEGPTLAPEEPLPTLEVVLAQQGRALEL
jgi:hypothetical protein